MIKASLIISTLLILLTLGISPALAQDSSNSAKSTVNNTIETRTFGGLFENVSNEDCIVKGKCNIKDFTRVLFNIGRWLVGISATVALVFMVAGGGLLITSAGNANRVEQGKNMLRGSVIGMAIIFSAWVIVGFIVGSFTGNPDGTILQFLNNGI